jgi:methylated-DNA-[protein]-cysteine S-methyltransferase
MPDDETQFDAVAETPLGSVGIRLEGGSVAEVSFISTDVRVLSPSVAEAEAAARQIEAYMHDSASPFTLPLALTGTPFQRRVWQALRKIPVGRVRTYGELARQLGTGPRAVGGACRANPCPLLVPCHRVVAAHGRGGYAGATSGRWPVIKEWLLRHEGVAWPSS